MNIEQKDILNKYAELKIQIKELESKAELLNSQVLDIITQNEVEEIRVGSLGKLLLGKRRNWDYPESVKSWEEDLKAKKKEAEQRGTATYVEKSYVIFSVNKEK